jgi:hypothetical protein
MQQSDGARALARFNIQSGAALKNPRPPAICALKRRERRAPLAPNSCRSIPPPAPIWLDKVSGREQSHPHNDRFATHNKVVMGTLHTAFRLLTFRANEDELAALNHRHLAFGLFCTWLVGMGRWWEDPKASLLQHLGVGSVAYIFVLAVFLWLVLWPLTPARWSFLNVLIFVSLTAPPAILYAIPVRHGLALQSAQTVRLWLLAIVAGWRVALLFFYLRRGAGLAGGRWILAALFPLLLIVFVLTALNLERVVFDFMGGIRAADKTVNDSAYGVLVLITMISMLAFLPLLASYLFLSVNSVLTKYGRRRGPFFYLLALALAVFGVTLNFYGQTFFGCVLMGSSLVIVITARFKLKEPGNT